MKLITLIISLFLLLSANAQPQWLNNFLNDKAVENAPVSICVANTENGDILLDKNAELCITPASTLKLITSAAALEILGADFMFETTVWYNGNISDKVLHGDLIISGGGDPTLGSDYMFGKSKTDFLHKWVKAVKQFGIDSIDGNIIADPFIYNDLDVPQTWIWEDLGNYFGAAAQGIALYDNTFRLVFETDDTDGGSTEVIGTEPFIPDLKLQNNVRSSNDNRDKAYVFGSPYDSFRIVKGTLPLGKEEFKVKASIPDPALLLAFELKNALSTVGVKTNGKYEKRISREIETVADSLKIIIWQSPPLNKIIEQLNYESINLFAEHLCKHLGLVVKGEGSTSAGVKVIHDFWKDKAVDDSNFFMADGCGLSRANAISAKTLVDVLNYMYADSINAKIYRNSIPKTGLQGTQQYYFQNSFLKGKARAKSGSMTRVRSFAGYMITQKRTSVSFAIMINNFDCSSFTMAAKMEKLMEGIYLDY